MDEHKRARQTHDPNIKYTGNAKVNMSMTENYQQYREKSSKFGVLGEAGKQNTEVTQGAAPREPK